jgi:hypothetical protein
LQREVQKQWETICDQVTDNFRVIDPAKYRNIK